MHNEIVKRKKALFPTLFMSAEERKAFQANMAAQVDQNNLGGSAAPIWQIISPEAIDAVSKKYFDLSRTNHVVEGYIPAAPGVRPVVNVEVITGAGGALKNATNWDQSDMENKYVPVTMDRYSRPFGLSSYDLMHGERIQTKIGAAIEAVVAQVINDFFALLYQNMGSPNTAPSNSTGGHRVVGPDAFTPEYAAQQLSPVFDGYGPIDDLILTPSYFAKLVPTNALSLGTEPGSYGIEYIHRSAGNFGNNIAGYALRKNAVAVAFGVPSYDELTGIAVQDLGRVAGIPLILKTWTNKGSEVIYNSVETLAGFKLANTLSLVGLSAS